MRNPQGYAHWFNGDIGVSDVERDTMSCFHCNVITFLDPFISPEDMGGMCKICMKLICKVCVDLGVCDPLENKLERQEANYRFLKSAGLLE